MRETKELLGAGRTSQESVTCLLVGAPVTHSGHTGWEAPGQLKDHNALKTLAFISFIKAQLAYSTILVLDVQQSDSTFIDLKI